eukprot:TRINITY_DN15439_c0_g1_i1.p1 TRINITY_DN15439_c0_g1~~TRINITY_DN15439_c0_g1_i1.p1  ORF type:complete len:355 (-),score=46.19 TRINITY_DN15439_c0_g1_i1:36-1100(-)
MQMLTSLLTPLAEGGYVPDAIVRLGVQSMLEERLQAEKQSDVVKQMQYKQEFIARLKTQPLAFNNEQPEMPTSFYQKTLDQKYLKYSACYFGFEKPNSRAKTECLEEAAEAMLNLYVLRSGVVNGMDILDLGCGWGSLSLFLAQKFPQSSITSLSNSAAQTEYIREMCIENNITNVRVIEEDIVQFIAPQLYDRIISIEMFEQMKNYDTLFRKISGWLKPNGKLFAQIFSHREYPYNFVPKDSKDWMSSHFLLNGTMPSDDLFFYFQRDLSMSQHWRIDGRNYGKTARCWLNNLDKNIREITHIFEETYGKEDAYKWVIRWRLFFTAVEEMFNFGEGQEWFVSQYLWEKKRALL